MRGSQIIMKMPVMARNLLMMIQVTDKNQRIQKVVMSRKGCIRRVAVMFPNP